MVSHQTDSVTYDVTIGGRVFRVRVDKASEARYSVDVDGKTLEVDVRRVEGPFYSLLIDGRSFQACPGGEPNGGEEAVVWLEGRTWTARVESTGRKRRPPVSPRRHAAGGHPVTAPIPGKVVKLRVAAGDRVSRGQRVIVLEAMKMENEIAAPADGVVKEIYVREGQAVDGGARLLLVESTG